MSGLVVDESLCRGCGLCVRACASRGIELAGERPHRVARVTDACILCGMCVESCPFGALSIERAQGAGAGGEGDGAGQATGAAAAWLAPEECSGVWVLALADGAALAPVSLELAGKGRELADARGVALTALLGCAPGAGEAAARELLAAGADRVLLCEDGRLAGRDVEAFAPWVCGLVRERRPEALLVGATGFGRELAPAVAVRLRTGLTADCTVLGIDAATGLLQQTRPAFGGNLMATITCPDRRPQMATVRPGVFPAPQAGPGRGAEPGPGRGAALSAVPAAAAGADDGGLPAGRVERVPLGQAAPARVEVLEPAAEDASGSITDADVLVVVGRGIGSQKNLPLMRRLAELLGGKLGCSRPLVEAGWCDYPCQVGQTGVSVAPKLLVSVGVSGAIQHLAGIGGAGTVVAINDDPAAPIFGACSYRVVGDCVEVVRELVELLEAQAPAGA